METNPSFLELYNKDKQSSLITRFLFFCINLFFSFDKGANMVSLSDGWIAQEGISRATARFFENFKIDIEPVGFKKLDRQSAYLIYGNHPTLIDPFAVISSLNCDQIKFFCGENLSKIDGHFGRHIFPIKNTQIINGRHRGAHWIYPLFFRSLAGYWDREEALIHNRIQVEEAAEFLAKGGKFMIFPFGQIKKDKAPRINACRIFGSTSKVMADGVSLYGAKSFEAPLSGTKEDKDFKEGVGFVLSKAMQKPYCKEIRILPFFVDIRHPTIFPLKALFRFRRKRMKIKIFFGQETNAEIYKDLVSDPQKLALELANDYLGFVRNLKR